jgi:hypothetical protein
MPEDNRYVDNRYSQQLEEQQQQILLGLQNSKRLVRSASSNRKRKSQTQHETRTYHCTLKIYNYSVKENVFCKFGKDKLVLKKH